MTPETLHRLFDVVADAPGGVQRLRELILQLAVRGKLVPQDPNDEPASVLLERIEEEKRRLYEEGKIRKLERLPPVEPDEVTLPVPKGWAYVRLLEIGEFCGGATPSKNTAGYWGGHIPWISPKDMGAQDITGSEDFITERALKETRLRLIPPGSLLIVARSGILRRTLPVSINRVPCTVNQDLKVLIPYMAELAEYLRLMLRGYESLIIRDLVKGGVTVQSLKFSQFAKFPFPLPPLEEQRRIVAKVNELMALCDELEERQRRRAEKRASLNRSALHHLATATDDADLARHWRRIRDHFDVLYEVPETVAELRQAILQLAVRGKLVPQDPNDEPASVLLERIEEEKRRLYNEGKIRKLEKLPPVGPDEVPFEVPEGWVWARFGDIAINRDAERVPLSSEVRARRRGPYPYYGASGIIDYVDDFLFDKPLLLIGEDGANLLLRSTPVAFLAEGRYWVNNHAHVIDGINVDLLRYLALFVNATDLGPYVTGTAQPKLNQAKLNAIAVALPPEAELARIVAKVDRLMALCDELEERLSKSRALAESVAAAVVHELTAA